MIATYTRTAAGWEVKLGDQTAAFTSLADLGKWAKEHDITLEREEG